MRSSAAGRSSSSDTSTPRSPAQAIDADGWYHTEDLAFRTPDGYITIADRKKDIIIRGGENVSASEVEEVLLRMPGVSEVAVVAAPDRAARRARLRVRGDDPGQSGAVARGGAGALRRRRCSRGRSGPRSSGSCTIIPAHAVGKDQEAGVARRASAGAPHRLSAGPRGVGRLTLRCRGPDVGNGWQRWRQAWSRLPTTRRGPGSSRPRCSASSSLGIDKTSLIDVARTADLSRGTVYRYFSDRQSLIDATVERNTENYYTEAAEVMSSERTLADQVGAFAEVFARNINNYRRNWLVNDDRELLRLLASDRDGGLRRMSTFIAPYVEAAKTRGEVAADLDERAASEWIARMFMSLTVMPGSTAFDASKPKSFRAFLERYTIDGLAPRAKRASRKTR